MPFTLQSHSLPLSVTGSLPCHSGSGMALAFPGVHLFRGQLGFSSTAHSGSNLTAAFAKGLFKFIGSNEIWQIE